MDYYITTAKTFQKKDERIQSILSCKKKKEQKLIIFYTAEDTIPFSQLSFLLMGEPNIPLELREITSDFESLAFGIFLGEHGVKENYYTILEKELLLPSDCPYNIKEYTTTNNEQPRETQEKKKRKKNVSVKTPYQESKPLPEKEEAPPMKISQPKKKKSSQIQIIEPQLPDYEEAVQRQESTSDFPGLEGPDMMLFMNYISFTPKEVSFKGTKEEMCNKIAEALYELNTSGGNVKSLLLNTFSEEAANKIITETAEKIDVLKNIVR